MTIHTGDCIEVMASLEPDSVDAVVTDPPYGLEFMGKGWDKFGGGVEAATDSPGWRAGHGGLGVASKNNGVPFGGGGQRVRYHAGPSFQAWCEAWGREALRVTKPGGYLLAFGGTRTHHRLVCGLEDAGWIIRDELDWIYATGFPKGKANLKPAHEPIVLARKPGPLRPLAIDECRIGTEQMPQLPGELGAHGIYGSMERRPVRGPTTTLDGWDDDANLCASCAADVANQARLGTSATRASTTPRHAELWPNEPDTSGDTSASPDTSASSGTTTARPDTSSSTARSGKKPTGRSPKATSSITSTETRPTTGLRICRSCGVTSMATITTDDTTSTPSDPNSVSTFDDPVRGRWPSNLLLSEPALFDEPNAEVVGSGAVVSSGALDQSSITAHNRIYGDRPMQDDLFPANSGGYSRFFIVPKADRGDREPVLRGQLELGPPPASARSVPAEGRQNALGNPRENAHPTVKPTDLMRHLVRLVTPQGGTVLDCFLGSGSTAIAAELEGFAWIGIEKEAEYVAIAEARLNGTQRGLGLDVPAPTRRRSNGDSKDPKRFDGVPRWQDWKQKMVAGDEDPAA